MAMSTVEIRETYLSFFREREHLLEPSASLIPSTYDPSVLLTTAGMQPFKPYFLGREDPPSKRICSVQRCFRTTDIEEVGNTARHCTFFEMLGNWSFGDYFKEETIPWGWELSVDGFGLDPEKIWVTVFEGDDELGLGPDEEAIEIWRKVGVPDERIVALPRSENFWQAGPTGPCGPCSEMYLDRGPEFGSDVDRPGGDNDRFVEYWNHVFMSYDLGEDGKVTPLPMRNIDTGMGLERMAAILQGVPSVFETDSLRPLIDLAEERSGKKRDADFQVTRAMRILADHSRGTAALIADGVVPSNEERGYVLRRIMRRAIQQGRSIGLEPPFFADFTERAVEKRTLELLGLLRRTNAVVAGFDKVEAALAAGRAAAVLTAADASPNAQAKGVGFAKAMPHITWLTVAEMSLALGRENVVHAALTPGTLTERFLREARRLRGLRGVSAPDIIDPVRPDPAPDGARIAHASGLS